MKKLSDNSSVCVKTTNCYKPLTVKFGHFEPTVCTGQLSTCIQLIGGIGINIGPKGSTTTIGATDTSGKKIGYCFNVYNHWRFT